MSLTIGTFLSTFLPDCAEDVPAKLIDAGTAARIEARSLAPLPEAIQALLSHVSPSLPGELPPGKLHPVGFEALPPSALALLRSHREQEAECVFADKSQGKCLVWPVPGDRSRAWALLPHGRCMELKRMASNNKQGYVYIDHLQRGGTSPIVLNIQPAMTLEAIEVKNRGTGLTQTVKTLELPQGLLDAGLGVLNEEGQALWRKRLNTVWQNLSTLSHLSWDKGGGTGEMYILRQGVNYRVNLGFKGDSAAAADSLATPETGWVYFLKITGKGDDNCTLYEEDWLRHALTQKGLKPPIAASFWRSPGDSSQPIYLDAALAFVETDMAPRGLSKKVGGKYSLPKLEDQALDALIAGGAFGHTLVGGVGAYGFYWGDAMFEVNYHLDKTGHGVAWMGIFHQGALLAQCGIFEEDEPDAAELYSVWTQRIAGLGKLDVSGRNAMIAYYKARDPAGTMAIEFGDLYLKAAIGFIVHLENQWGLTIDDLKEKTYEERIRKAQQYFAHQNFQSTLFHQRTLLAPFMVWLKQEGDRWSEGINDPAWLDRLGPGFTTDVKAPRNREALVGYCRGMHAAGVKQRTLRLDAIHLVRFLKRLETKKIVLDDFACQSDMEACLKKHEKNSNARFAIKTFMSTIMSTITEKASLRARNLPKGDQNKKDLEAFIAWLYPGVDQTTMQRETSGYVVKATLANWMCHIESGQDGDKAVRARDVVIAAYDKKGALNTRKGEKDVDSTRLRRVRMFSVWAHLQAYREKPGGCGNDYAHLNDWLLWRKDNFPASKGRWQLIDQFRDMTDKEWLKQVANYLNLNAKGIRMDDRDAVRTSMNAFREWVRARHSWQTA